MHDQPYRNRLSQETSPYLLQHAHNPVDWYPWGEDALAVARRENKPILLSIGYSACHWCHVMAHESFEDEDSARVMNELFVNIKVDREERPDIDKIYQTAFQLLNRRAGGWPLTMFLTPHDQVPFYGATYVPKEPRYGMLAFTDLLRRIDALYRQREADIRGQNDELMRYLSAELTPRTPTGDALIEPGPLRVARDQLLRSFDDIHGGFGQAPKFPHPTSIERLMRHARRSALAGQPDPEAQYAAIFTLRRMALGGIYDQLGGGFSRYSVDERWLIPHFEKMLYDNGPLLALYSEAWKMTDDPLFKRVAEETAAWIAREMQAPDGGYYASLDADSEGEEGKFYVWTSDEVRALLAPTEYAVFASRYGLDGPANFEGAWHLFVAREVGAVARQSGVSEAEAEVLLASARRKLMEVRERRVWPGRDEKILSAWNALSIKGMAVAGRHLDRADYLTSAERALDFIRAQLWRDGRLLAVYKDGIAKHSAYLDDYAFLLDAVLEMLQARWRRQDLDFAIMLADALLAHFQDAEGGFFFTADDHERLIQRPKLAADDALPAGNGIAAQALLKLGQLLGNSAYLRAAERALRWAWPVLEQAPVACGALLLALEEVCFPGQTVVLRGALTEMAAWRQRLRQEYAPERLSLTIPANAGDLPGLLAARTARGTVTAYVCNGPQCSAPITALADLEQVLAGAAIL